MTVLKRDSQQHTYSDYLMWSRTSGDELLDGTAYVKEPPSPTWSHQSIIVELSYQIRRALEGTHWRVCIAPLDVRLPKSDEPDDEVDTVVQPDVFITGDVGKVDSRGLRGAPDWLAEVLSPGTARYDRRRKIPVYERAGVPEVWLIDFNQRTAAIYRLSAGHYGPPTIVGLQGKTQLTVVPEVTIHWEPIIAQVGSADNR
ncbi:MAG: Uma2 family endonuclease [Proteobacteria bacterium]|nr:Uma2 family endonuclease [Pseudomonadota bacterium]